MVRRCILAHAPQRTIIFDSQDPYFLPYQVLQAYSLPEQAISLHEYQVLQRGFSVPVNSVPNQFSAGSLSVKKPQFHVPFLCRHVRHEQTYYRLEAAIQISLLLF